MLVWRTMVIIHCKFCNYLPFNITAADTNTLCKIRSWIWTNASISYCFPSWLQALSARHLFYNLIKPHRDKGKNKMNICLEREREREREIEFMRFNYFLSLSVTSAFRLIVPKKAKLAIKYFSLSVSKGIFTIITIWF